MSRIVPITIPGDVKVGDDGDPVWLMVYADRETQHAGRYIAAIDLTALPAEARRRIDIQVRSHLGPDPLADCFPRRHRGGEREHETNDDAHAAQERGLL